ncbi:MAG: phosphoribosyltransferase [Chloroflexaceae bacterium]
MAGFQRLHSWILGQGRRFHDRTAAGRALAARLTAYADRPDTIVLALPRGGVPVGYEIATALNAPLDLMLVRKLGVPGEEELAMGAIAEGGVRVLNTDVVRGLRIDPDTIAQVAAREGQELERRGRLYRGGRLAPDLRGKTVILVDDGLATGATMRAAIVAARAQEPARIIVAAPVAARETVALLESMVDEVIVVQTPEPLAAIGLWYEEFPQVSDEEVRALLRRAAERPKTV